MSVTVYLGNRAALEVLREKDGTEHHVALPPDEYCTVVEPPAGTPLAEVFKDITNPGGMWASHSEAPPAWVAVSADDQVYGDALAMLISAHYGCEIRDPEEG